MIYCPPVHWGVTTKVAIRTQGPDSLLPRPKNETATKPTISSRAISHRRMMPCQHHKVQIVEAEIFEFSRQPEFPRVKTSKSRSRRSRGSRPGRWQHERAALRAAQDLKEWEYNTKRAEPVAVDLWIEADELDAAKLQCAQSGMDCVGNIHSSWVRYIWEAEFRDRALNRRHMEMVSMEFEWCAHEISRAKKRFEDEDQLAFMGDVEDWMARNGTDLMEAV